MSLHRSIALCSLLLLGACSGGSAPPTPAQTQAANAAQATKQAALYEQLRQSGSADVALTLGKEILSKYPGTAEAAKVQQSIGEVQAKADAQAKLHRLKHLWGYTETPEAGGKQHTAAIVSQAPLTASKKGSPLYLRLVLRQHPKWGQSVYLNLMLPGAVFDCSKGCKTLAVSFDGAPAERMKATIPPTGEPSLFIDDDKGFIAKLEKAQKVAITINVKDVGEKTAEFEVGGYDPAKMPDKPPTK
jgi:hypothetical protein